METPIQPVQPVPPPAPSQKGNTQAIISLVTGLLGFLTLCISMFLVIVPVVKWLCPALGGLFGLVGVITGFLGMNGAKALEGKGRGLAIAGLVLGILAILGVCVVVILNIAAGQAIGNIFSQITSGLNSGSGGY